MSLSELLDRTFTLYRNHFWLFCGLMALPEVVIVLFQLLSLTFFPVHVVSPTAVNPQDPFSALAGMKSNFGATFVVLILSAVCKAFSLGAVTLAVSELCLGRPATIWESYRKVKKRVAGLFGLILLLLFLGFLLVFAGVFVGALLGILMASGLTAATGSSAALKVVVFILVMILVLACVAGGAFLAFWLLMRFAVSIPVFMLEKLGVGESLTRSGVLTRGHRWRIFGAVIIMYIVSFGVQSVLSLPFIILTAVNAAKGVLPLWIQMGTTLAGAVGGTLAGPLMMITLALVYYDVRIRKEAFDLENMMASLSPSTPVAGTPAPGVQ
jgi:hypothetical protein